MELEYIDKLDASSILNKDIFFQLFSIEEEFERAEKYQQLENRAEALKIKTKFKQLYKAFLSDFKKALPDKEQGNNITAFHDQPTLDCGMWNASDSGIWMNTDKGRIWACYHPIYPARILTNIETNICKVELHYCIRGRWKELLIDKNVISSRSSIIKLSDYGIQVTSENAGLLVQYLIDIESLNPDIIQEFPSIDRLGWLGNKFMPYEPEIAFDNVQSYLKLYRSIQCVGSRDLWYKTAKKIRRMGRIEPLLFIAASLASVLVEPCNVLPFIVALWGETGGGKTVSLKLAASIWADPAEGIFITDAKSTKTAMELKLNTLNSLPMLIDDFSQINNQWDGDFSNFIYFLAAGSGKERATATLSLRGGTFWKNCTLANAERSLSSETAQGGAVNRVIEIEVEKDIYPQKMVSDIMPIFAQNYGYCGYEFVQVIKDIGFEKISEIQRKYKDQLVEKSQRQQDKKEMKQIIPVSVLLTADELAEQYLFKDGIRLDFNECYKLIKGHNEVSENIRAYQYLRDTIAGNQNKFYTDENYGEIWGDYDAVNNTIRFIASAFDKVMKAGGFQSKTFLSWAAKNRLVQTDAKGSAKIVTKMGKHSIRCVHIRLMDEPEEQITMMENDNPFV